MTIYRNHTHHTGVVSRFTPPSLYMTTVTLSHMKLQLFFRPQVTVTFTTLELIHRLHTGSSSLQSTTSTSNTMEQKVIRSRTESSGF